MNISTNARQIRDSITALFERGSFDEGLSQLKQASDLPKVVELECLGNLHFYKRELQDAIRSYEFAILMDPSYRIARYQYLVATQDEKRGDLVSAFKRFQEAIDIEPGFVDPYVELGGLLVKVGDLEGAAQCYRDATRIEPTNLGIMYNLKAVFTRLAAAQPEKYRGDLQDVESAFRQLEKNGATLPADHIR
jgi:tetratricopeptide (TPR) repeat protein